MTVYGEDPCAQARKFLEAGAKNLHVVDLDGAKDGTLSNYEAIAALAKHGGLYIEVGGGIRTEERIETYLSLGVAVQVGVFLALIVAVLLNAKIKGKTAFRAIFFLPMVVAPAAVAMVWKWIFNAEYGILNQVLGANIRWLLM